jgi:hypothetical protein
MRNFNSTGEKKQRGTIKLAADGCLVRPSSIQQRLLILVVISSGGFFLNYSTAPCLLPPSDCLLNNAHDHALADGCHYVFVDVGANIGVHGRFLFEPWKYPNATVASNIFNQTFGSKRDNRDICVLALEANPNHLQRLHVLSRAYQSIGWTYHVVSAAASREEGNLTFYHQGDEDHQEWGFSSVLQRHDSAIPRVVPALRLSSWLDQHVLQRKLPSNVYGSYSTTSPMVVLKLDVEGSEYGIVLDLLGSGVLCQGIDYMFGEWHPHFFFKAKLNIQNPLLNKSLKLTRHKQAVQLQRDISTLVSNMPDCKTRAIDPVDDETYLFDGQPLPDPTSRKVRD